MTEHELTPSGYAQAVVARCVMFGYRDGTKAECQLLLIKVLSNWRTARYVTDEDKRELLEKGFDIGERPHTSGVCFDDQNIRFHYYMRGSKPILVYPFRQETIEKSVCEDVKRLEREDWRKLTKPLAFRIRHRRTRTICAKSWPEAVSYLRKPWTGRIGGDK